MALNGDDDFEWEPPTEAEMKVLEAQRERQNKISKLMGDYLLKGYKMLGDCCQHCATILLEDRQKNIYCVACQELDSDVDKDNPALNAQAALSQVRERQLANSSNNTNNQSPHQPNDETPPPGPPSSASRPIRSLPRPEHCEGAASGLRAPAGATSPWPAPVTPTPALTASTAPQRPPTGTASPLDPTGTSASTSSSSPGGSGTGTGALRVPGHAPMGGVMQQTVLEAEQAVLGKMQWAVCQLTHSSASVESSSQLCQLIQTCANTLRTLRDLHRD